jgi:hypothetical protein
MAKVGEQHGNTTVIAVDEAAGVVVTRRKGAEYRSSIADWDRLMSPPVELSPPPPEPTKRRGRKRKALVDEG